MALIRAINWPATVASVQAALDGTTYGPLSQAALTSGVEFRTNVQTAGATYDLQSTDGILNTSAYASAVQRWATVAQPAWVELDRVCRSLFQNITPTNNLSRASFGTSDTPGWQAQTQYFFGDASLGGVQASPANGFSYVCTSSGTSGVVAPSWSTTLGSTTVDNTCHWQCASVVGSGATPVALPWDVTLQTQATLNARHSASLLLTLHQATNGFSELLSIAYAAWVSALASQPAPNPTLDALSLSANNSLTGAIDGANKWLAAAAVK